MGIYLLAGLMFLLLVFSLRENFDTGSACTYKEFQQMLNQDEFVKVEVVQNQEVPTGSLIITVRDGSVNTINVSDVKEIQAMLEQYDVTVVVRDVEKDSIFLTTMLPILLMGALLLFFMAMMNRQAGGGNAKMMNLTFCL